MGLNDNQSTFNARVVSILKSRAEGLGLSLRMLAERSGVSKSKLQAVFSGERAMLVADMEAVAEALGLVPWLVMKEASLTDLSAAPDSLPNEWTLSANRDEEEPEQ